MSEPEPAVLELRPVALGDGADLRLLRQDDAPELFALVDANRLRLRRWMDWLDATRTEADSRAFIASAQERLARREGTAAAIVAQGRVVGTVSLHTIDWKSRCGELAYWIDAACEGRGLVTRACRAMCEHAFADWKLNRVEIRCATENGKSRAVPERLGFRLEGTLRAGEWLYDHFVDLAVYGRLAADRW
jgi:ribosomal-protein-serine acetyltransferase